MFSKSELTYYKFLKLSHKVENNIKNALKPLGITHSQLNILHLLNDAYPAAMNVKDLKERMVVNQPDMSRLIDRLVVKKLVERHICSENRRMVDIFITKNGKTTFKEAQKLGEKATGNCFGDFLSEKETVELYKTLNKIKL